MKSIENRLASYVKGNSKKISNKTITSLANKDADDIINTLFNLINKELDSINDSVNTSKIFDLLDYVYIIMTNQDDVNRGIIGRKLLKLDEKLSRIKLENKNKFFNYRNICKSLDKIENKIEEIRITSIETNSKQYEFINYLIEEIKNINYIEYTFSKMPSLLNVEDKNNKSLIVNIVKKYTENTLNDNEEDTLYYSNIIFLMLSEKKLELKTSDKREILELIYTTIDQLSSNKKNTKKNKSKIYWLHNLVNAIKGINDKTTKIDLIASKYNISIFFDEDILEAAKLVKANDDNRYIIDDYTITIDHKDAVEIDDALSCKRLSNGNYLLGVHIASVLGYFDYESDIVKEALSRNRSIYLPRNYQAEEGNYKKTIPIFPYDFSARTASLTTNSKKLARSYLFEIDNEGNVVNEKFLKTIITSNKQVTYDEVNKIIEHGTKDQELQELITNLQNVTSLLERNYKGTNIYEKIKESTDDFSDLRVKRIGSEKIVYQAMLLTGNRVANFFAESKEGYPCLYRVHEINEENAKKLADMVDNLTKTYGGEQYKKLYNLIEGLYPKGWYDIEGSHTGLGLEHYCHCTSGLRRAADIVVEHALETCYDKNPTDRELMRLETEIKRQAVEINAKQDPIDWFVKDYKRAYQKRR